MRARDGDFDESRNEAPWRRPAPGAQALAMRLYQWRDPRAVFLAGLLAALPLAVASALAPALLSIAPTGEVIGPIAGARALVDGAAPLASAPSLFHSAHIVLADRFADAPGRIHLIAKAIAAGWTGAFVAWLAASRFAALAAALLAAMIAASVVAPFAGAPAASLAALLIAAIALLCPPGDGARARVRAEGAIAGFCLIALYLSGPAFAVCGLIVAGFAMLANGRGGLVRAIVALAILGAAALGLEYAAPGFAQTLFGDAARLVLPASGYGGAPASAGITAAAAIVIVAAAVFGGREHWRSWGVAAGLAIVTLAAAHLGGADPAPALALAAIIAAFSVASPFYEGVFRRPDRASLAVALAAAGLALFWTGAEVAGGARQLVVQARAAADAPADIRAAFALVQPGAPTIAERIIDGRFSTTEARGFALGPADQSAMLLDGAARARALSEQGLDVAILTGSDAACVIAATRACRADGAQAAGAASVVLVPRLDLDAKARDARGRAEALLYTDFRLTERSALWDVWVRRGAELPDALAGVSALKVDQALAPTR